MSHLYTVNSPPFLRLPITAKPSKSFTTQSSLCRGQSWHVKKALCCPIVLFKMLDLYSYIYWLFQAKLIHQKCQHNVMVWYDVKDDYEKFEHSLGCRTTNVCVSVCIVCMCVFVYLFTQCIQSVTFDLTVHVKHCLL